MTEVEVTLLGTSAAIPTFKRNHPAVSLIYRSKHEYSFLFDCGEGTQKQLMLAKINFMRISHIFITHWHADHFAGLLGLLETMGLEGRTAPLYIHAPEATRFLDMLLSLGYSTREFDVVARDVEFDTKKETIVLEEKEFKILSIPVKHRIPAVAYAFVEKDRIKLDKEKLKEKGLPLQSRAYKILKEKGVAKIKGKLIRLDDVSFIEKGKKIVYTGDTAYTSRLVKFSRNANLLIADCTYFEEVEDNRYHMTLQDVIKVVEEADVEKVVLTHISRRYQNEKELQKLLVDKRFILGRDLLKLKIK